MVTVIFTKMQGTGNDFIVFEENDLDVSELNSIAEKLCDRHYGIGADGILVARKSEEADIEMIIINADGSDATMCGNGIRCFAKYLYENNIVNKKEIEIKTGDGIKTAFLKLKEDKVIGVKINMGIPDFNPEKIPVIFQEKVLKHQVIINGREYFITSLLLGVPHTVILGDLNSFDVTEGGFIEKDIRFPIGTNVNFCQVISPTEIIVKTWERGAGPTLSCGTGSCACAVVTNLFGLTNSLVKVKVPGGELMVEITTEGTFMTGPAEVSFVTDIEI